jgi:hypothetical protein
MLLSNTKSNHIPREYSVWKLIEFGADLLQQSDLNFLYLTHYILFRGLFCVIGFLVVGTDDSAVSKRPLKRECGSGLISSGRQDRIQWRVVVSQ